MKNENMLQESICYIYTNLEIPLTDPGYILLITFVTLLENLTGGRYLLTENIKEKS